MFTLDFSTLRGAVAGSYVAIRSRTTLQPAGGPGDKVFPSTYGVSAGAATKYAIERHVVNGEPTARLNFWDASIIRSSCAGFASNWVTSRRNWCCWPVVMHLWAMTTGRCGCWPTGWWN